MIKLRFKITNSINKILILHKIIKIKNKYFTIGVISLMSKKMFI